MEANYVRRRYFKPGEAGGFSGLSGFLNNNKIKNKNEIVNTLKELKTYNLHVPARKKFARNPLNCPYINYMWVSDLIVYLAHKKENRGFSYIYLTVDCLSRRVYAFPMKKKDTENIITALKAIFKKAKSRPSKIFMDQESAAFSKKMSEFLKKENVEIFYSFSPLKASLSEIYVRRVKRILARAFTHNNNNRWVDILDSVIENINSSYNRSIGFASSEVSQKNESEVFHNLYKKYIGKRKKSKLAVNDLVKISATKVKPFQKGYDVSWSTGTYIIKEVNALNPVPFYRLMTTQQEDLPGQYYFEDLLKVSKIENED